MEKIIAENRIRYAQRGDYACLVERSSQTARRSNDAQLQTRDLPRANNTGKQKQQSTHGNGAMHTKMMI